MPTLLPLVLLVAQVMFAVAVRRRQRKGQREASRTQPENDANAYLNSLHLQAEAAPLKLQLPVWMAAQQSSWLSEKAGWLHNCEPG